MGKVDMTGGVDGLEFATQSVHITCTEALSKGEVVEFTLSGGKYEACTKTETADILPSDIIGVAAEDVDAGAKGTIVLSGTVEVSCDDEVTAGAVLRGSGDAAARLDLLAVPGANADSFVKCVGIALEAADGAGDLVPCIFDGVQGFSCATDAS